MSAPLSSSAAPVASRLWRWLGLLCLGALMVWGALALWFPNSGAAQWLLPPAWVVLNLAAGHALLAAPRWRRGMAWSYGLACALLLAWWLSLAPSNNRAWADDVARLLRVHQEGHWVELENVRDFRWRSDDDYTVRWDNRRYDLEQLDSVDLILSTWGMPAIAHTLVSFGFRDGQRVVFSVEIRKKRGEHFSELGGFFKQFELALVAADERDILHVRAVARGEQVSRYPLRMPRAAMRELFLVYARQADALREQPRFYYTLTANCTTLVYDMARVIAPGLPWDYRLLLSGYLPEYLYAHGALDPTVSLAQWRAQADITARLAQAALDTDFSQAVRRPPSP